MKKMKKIDKSFKSQQEIFAWLGSGGKVAYKDSGNIISFIDGKLVSETYNVEVTRDFNVSKDWEKVLPPSWEDFLEEYDILCFTSDHKSLVDEKDSRIDFVKKKFKEKWVDKDNCPWKFAQPIEISDLEILEGKWLGKKKEKECSTE